MGKKPQHVFRLLVFFGAATLFGCATLPRQDKAATQSSLAIVQQYLAALNRRDLLMLTAYVAPDVEWYSVVNGERMQEVSGREALKQMLMRYFEQHRHTQWVLEQSNAAENFLAATERSEWDEGGANSSRTSLCVYELHDGRIRRMTYFLASH